jgi:hypothetical protein
MVLADRPIERHARSPALSDDLCALADEGPTSAKRLSRMLDLAHADANGSDVPAGIVDENSQQCFLIATGRNRARSYVPADVEARIVDPNRRTEATRRLLTSSALSRSSAE